MKLSPLDFNTLFAIIERSARRGWREDFIRRNGYRKVWEADVNHNQVAWIAASAVRMARFPEYS